MCHKNRNTCEITQSIPPVRSEFTQQERQKEEDDGQCPINQRCYFQHIQKTTISPVTEFVYERRSKMNSTKSPLTLRKSDHKNQVNYKENQEIFLKHLINHDHKRSNQSKAPATQTYRNIRLSIICIILQMIRKPNSIIVLLFTQNNS